MFPIFSEMSFCWLSIWNTMTYSFLLVLLLRLNRLVLLLLPLFTVSFNIAPRSKRGRGRIIRESRIPGYLESLQLFQRDIRDLIPESSSFLRTTCVLLSVQIGGSILPSLSLYSYFCRYRWSRSRKDSRG